MYDLRLFSYYLLKRKIQTGTSVICPWPFLWSCLWSKQSLLLKHQVRDLDSKQKLYVEQVEELTRELKSLDAQKQEELQKMSELKSECHVACK